PGCQTNGIWKINSANARGQLPWTCNKPSNDGRQSMMMTKIIGNTQRKSMSTLRLHVKQERTNEPIEHAISSNEIIREAHRSQYGLTSHFGFDRVCNETLLVRLMVHGVDFVCCGRPFTFKYDVGSQSDQSHCKFAVIILGHYADSIISVAVNHESALRSDRQEPQHVTA